MKFAITALLAAASCANAHYIFWQFTAGSTTYSPYQYVRYNTNYNSPVIDLTSNDLRCNVNGQTLGNTSTVAVKAGSSFTFTLNTAVYHQGPISIYMSKAPSTAAQYLGDGGWFKTADFGPTFNGGTATWPMRDTYTSTIPSCLAPGEYLLRIQSLAIHNPYPGGIPQFYISCAQVSVSGASTTKTPTATVSIPGAFKSTDPGYTANIYSNFNSYTIPGPSVFSC